MTTLNTIPDHLHSASGDGGTQIAAVTVTGETVTAVGPNQAEVALETGGVAIPGQPSIGITRDGPGLVLKTVDSVSGANFAINSAGAMEWSDGTNPADLTVDRVNGIRATGLTVNFGAGECFGQLDVDGNFNAVSGSVALGDTSFIGGVGFYGTAVQTKPTVTGSRVANPALASLLTALANLGLVVDSTTI